MVDGGLMNKWIWCTVAVVIFFAESFSQTKGMKVPEPTMSEGRIALVIGNAKYATSPLRNPENDAKDIAATLRRMKFSVAEYTNLTNRQMVDAVAKFGDQLNKNTVALFYYSGHGVQVGGKNYLIPVGAKINKEQDVEFEAVDAGRIIAEMEHAQSKMNIVILDACRDNPLPKTVRNVTRGMVVMDAPMGTVIAFSTAPGKVASDGDGHNGLYTGSLIKYLNVPNLKIEDVFKRVRAEVASTSNGVQTPWENSSIVGNFYFLGGETGSTAPAEPPPVAAQPPPKGFSLDDIDKEVEAKKAEAQRIASEREQKLNEMREAYQKVRSLQKENIDPEKKRIAKDRFLQYFAADLDWTTEDEQMRKSLTLEISIQWIHVEGGTFSMGSDKGSDEKPIHTVSVNSFYIGATEVTFDQYDMFCKTTGREKPNDEGWGRGKRPVINVSWNDAVAYCQWASEMAGTEIRLPTEAEWEYAARGGSKSRGFDYSGSSNVGEVAWYSGNSGGKTHEAATKQANELGIYDMSGNVWEWCADWYNENYYSQSPTSNPTGPNSGASRVLRGGSWFNGVDLYCRVASRYCGTPGNRNYNYGFRCSRTK
jgi:formylglycine-generating enzyme required for sulfatase activity